MQNLGVHQNKPNRNPPNIALHSATSHQKFHRVSLMWHHNSVASRHCFQNVWLLVCSSAFGKLTSLSWEISYQKVAILKWKTTKLTLPSSKHPCDLIVNGLTDLACKLNAQLPLIPTVHCNGFSYLSHSFACWSSFHAQMNGSQWLTGRQKIKK